MKLVLRLKYRIFRSPVLFLGGLVFLVGLFSLININNIAHAEVSDASATFTFITPDVIKEKIGTDKDELGKNAFYWSLSKTETQRGYSVSEWIDNKYHPNDKLTQTVFGSAINTTSSWKLVKPDTTNANGQKVVNTIDIAVNEYYDNEKTMYAWVNDKKIVRYGYPAFTNSGSLPQDTFTYQTEVGNYIRFKETNSKFADCPSYLDINKNDKSKGVYLFSSPNDSESSSIAYSVIKYQGFPNVGAGGRTGQLEAQTMNGYKYVNTDKTTDKIGPCFVFKKGYTDADKTTATDTTVSVALSDINATATPATSSSATTDQNGSKSECTVEKIGWIVCPVLNFISMIIDGGYKQIDGEYLPAEISIFSQTGNVYKVWQVIRNLANIGLVIAFLIIIFSQLSSIGISNYGIKKMLPRLVVAAILINVSFWVCTIAADISNVLGRSIKDIFTQFDFLPAFKKSGVATGFETLSGIALVGGAAAIAGSLSVLGPVAIAGVIAVSLAFLILAARQALIVFLVIVAPLAFLAYMLPNTEKLFTQWRKIFFSMLLIYPAIALVYYTSQLASDILHNAF